MTAKYQMKIGELRRVLAQLPEEDDDRFLGVYLPYYRRTFSVVAADDLCNIENKGATAESPLILIASKRPQ